MFDQELKTPPYDDVLNEIKKIQELCLYHVERIHYDAKFHGREPNLTYWQPRLDVVNAMVALIETSGLRDDFLRNGIK